MAKALQEHDTEKVRLKPSRVRGCCCQSSPRNGSTVSMDQRSCSFRDLRKQDRSWKDLSILDTAKCCHAEQDRLIWFGVAPHQLSPVFFWEGGGGVFFLGEEGFLGEGGWRKVSFTGEGEESGLGRGEGGRREFGPIPHWPNHLWPICE